MLNSLPLIAALASSIAFVSAQNTPPPRTSVSAAPGSLSLGSICSSKEQCANDADCYGVTAFTITTCGSFQSSCERDDQCATNTCNQGLCNGFLATSLYKTGGSATSTISSTSSSNSTSPSGTSTVSSTTSAILPIITADPGSLGLGSSCSEDNQCQNGVQCFGSTAFTIKRCGGFNAACTSNSQCSTNTCNNGICNGFLESSLWVLPSSTNNSPLPTSISTLNSTSTARTNSSIVTSTRSNATSSSNGTSSTASYVYTDAASPRTAAIGALGVLLLITLAI